jgi:hypothetical protein
MGFDLARDRHHSLCSGRRAYRVGLARPPFRKRSGRFCPHPSTQRGLGRAEERREHQTNRPTSPESQPRPHFSQIVKERSASDSSNGDPRATAL